MPSAVRRACAALTLCSVVASPVLPAASQPFEIPEIVVTPNYTPTPLDQIGSSVSVIRRSQIARASPASVAQLLRSVPGVTVIESGGRGGSSEVRLRGAETGHTLMLIDGVRVNDPATARGDFDFVNLSLNDVERVEILRGPQSAVYGSDAMGGVVNIITRKQAAKSSVTATVEAGSYGTVAERATAGMRAGDFSLRFSGGHLASSGFSRRGDRDLSEPDGTEKWTGSFRGAFEPADGPKIEVGATGSHQLSDYDGATGSGANALNTVTRTLVSGFTKVSFPTVGLLDQSLTGFFARSNRRNVEPGAAPPLADFVSADVGGEYQGVLNLAALGNLTFGVRLDHEDARNSAQTSISFPGFSSARTFYAGYLEHQITAFERLHLTFSGRYDGAINGEGFLTGRATAAYLMPEHGTTLRASVGTGAKRPTAYQVGNNLFAAAKYPAANVDADLDPERSFGVDGGIDQSFFDGALRVSATAFYNRFQKLLGFTFISAGDGYYENIDKAETKGVELVVDTDIFPGFLSATAAYTWMPTRNLSTGKPLPRRPEHSGSFSVTLTPAGGFDATLSAIFVGPRINLASSTTTMPAYMRFDVSTTLALNDQTKLFARVENLTDERYQDPSGFNTPGVSAYVGLTWTN